MNKVTYRIQNSNGRQGVQWTLSYETRDNAAEGLRDAMGWDEIVLSPSYAISERVGDGDAAVAWSGYETRAECDADTDGAHAPRVVEVAS